jgi:DNA-binding transcriptional ArsR family regulator
MYGVDETAPTDAYAAIFTALAHPARRRILIALHFAGGELGAGAIAGLFAHAWPTTTRHLQALEAARLIRHEKRGRARLYRLARDRVALARDWLDWFGRDPVTAKELPQDDRHHAAPVPAQSRSGRC